MIATCPLIGILREFNYVIPSGGRYRRRRMAKSIYTGLFKIATRPYLIALWNWWSKTTINRRFRIVGETPLCCQRKRADQPTTRCLLNRFAQYRFSSFRISCEGTSSKACSSARGSFEVSPEWSGSRRLHGLGSKRSPYPIAPTMRNPKVNRAAHAGSPILKAQIRYAKSTESEICATELRSGGPLGPQMLLSVSKARLGIPTPSIIWARNSRNSPSEESIRASVASIVSCGNDIWREKGEGRSSAGKLRPSILPHGEIVWMVLLLCRPAGNATDGKSPILIVSIHWGQSLSPLRIVKGVMGLFIITSGKS